MTQTLPPAIGQLYDPTRPGLPEGMSWRLSPRGVELLLSFPQPSQDEIEAVHGHTGPAEFALIEEPNVLMLCCRFGQGIRWQCQPWQACRQEAGYPAGLPGASAAPDFHLRLDIHLVDANTGVLCAHGEVSWPPPFVAAVRAAVDRHLTGPQDDSAAGAEIDELYRRWPKTADMVRDRAEATCRRGGVQE
jgi:hypothetical protein